MKQKIKELIQQHKERKQECFEQLEELSKLSGTKISKEEKEVLRTSMFYLSQEYDLRSVFVSELESFIV